MSQDMKIVKFEGKRWLVESSLWCRDHREYCIARSNGGRCTVREIQVDHEPTYSKGSLVLYKGHIMEVVSATLDTVTIVGGGTQLKDDVVLLKRRYDTPYRKNGKWNVCSGLFTGGKVVWHLKRFVCDELTGVVETITDTLEEEVPDTFLNKLYNVVSDEDHPVAEKIRKEHFNEQPTNERPPTQRP